MAGWQSWREIRFVWQENKIILERFKWFRLSNVRSFKWRARNRLYLARHTYSNSSTTGTYFDWGCDRYRSEVSLQHFRKVHINKLNWDVESRLFCTVSLTVIVGYAFSYARNENCHVLVRCTVACVMIASTFKHFTCVCAFSPLCASREVDTHTQHTFEVAKLSLRNTLLFVV